MKDPNTEPEPQPEQDEDYLEYRDRVEALELELHSGRISAAEYERRKAEAWEVYRARGGRLPADDEDRRGGGNPPG
jgi:hypothetical protein